VQGEIKMRIHALVTKKDAEENKSNEVHKQKDQVENAGHNNLLTKKKFQKNLILSL
jgi:hypothetical protein